MRITHRLPTIAISALLLMGLIPATKQATQAQTAPSSDSYRIPEAPPNNFSSIPQNLARWYIGATLVLVRDGEFQHIQVSDVRDFDESLFLSDNSALSYKIQLGQHDFIIDLGKSIRVSRFFLNNQSAAGSFNLLCSDTLDDLNSEAWIKLSDSISFENGVIPSVTFPEIEIRYILIRFDIHSAGTIGNFGLTGTTF